ncbi:MAG: hypothetical protein KC593_19105 [Myxococcales bacterium]|nr:hypothetical protein [Myxococcales bacterium]MCB9626627.1 hypothetical protein [Sandaracinaceae bacterium]
MKKRNVGVVMCGAVWLLLGVGCASGGTPRPRLPAEEHALLELMPNDAFLGVRVDMRALRATPHWQELEQAMVTGGAAEDVQRYFRDTDRVVAVVGGFIDAPSYPEPDPEAPPVQAPAWVAIAQGLNGKLPRAVAVIEGEGAALCDTALEGQERREVRGYQLGVVNGIALLRGERVCVVTLEPVLDSLLTQARGPAADVLGMLAAPGPGGAASIMSYVADYSAPGYAAWVEQHGAAARAQLEASRQRRREAAEAAAAAAESGETTSVDELDALAGLGDFASRMEEVVNQTIVLFLEVSKITMRGMVSTSMQLSHHDGGYDFRSRVAISDEGRSVMWRELLRMYLDIARAAVAVYDIPDEPREVLTAALNAVRIEERPDGYEVVARASDRRVTSLLAFAQREGADLVPNVPDVDGFDSPWVLIGQIERAEYDSAPDVISGLEPNLARILEMSDRDARRRGLVLLARAYASLGRYQDAVSLLNSGVENDRAHAATVEYYMRPDVFAGMCGLAAELCEQQLEWGFAELAGAAAAMVADEGQTCADVSYQAFACGQVAEARQGRAEAALAAIEERSWGEVDVVQFGAARSQVLGELGRWDSAFEAARATCVGPLTGSTCPSVFPAAVSAMARGGSTLAQHDAAFELARASYPGTVSGNLAEDSTASLVALGDCARRVRLAPRDAATLTACVAAGEVTARLHGSTHPRTALALLFLSMARDAGGDAAGAAAARQELDAIRSSLGPQHAANQPAPAPPTGARRPARRPR